MILSVTIHDLIVKTVIGIHPRERDSKQKLILQISFKYNAQRAMATDKIDHAVDYEEITKKIIKKISSTKFHLLEKLAQLVLKIVLEDRRILEASVRIDKPKAMPQAQSISVELTAKR